MLNAEQKKAAETLERSVFVNAGPGSGKTRTLSARIVNLIKSGASPTEIVAFTFTRNAAAEMCDRIMDALGEATARKIWITTIHGFCAKVLASWGWKVGLKDNFSIYDDRDQLDIIRSVQKDLTITTKPETFLREINRGNINPKRVVAFAEFAYRLRQNNATNYRGLLQKVIHIFTNHSDVLDHYSNRFRYVHLDEMSDTSDMDYSIIKLACSKHKNLFACGDINQCIYTFRGSHLQNIDRLKLDITDHDEIYLDRTYRCTVPVIDACNKIIAHNEAPRTLTSQKVGPPVTVTGYIDEDAEAQGVAQSIVAMKEAQERVYSDFAVLCRTHAIASGIASALKSEDVPISVAGTTVSFLDLEEVHLFHSYLKAIDNPRDNHSFDKVMHYPPKGISRSDFARISSIARQSDVSLLEATLAHLREAPEEKRQWIAGFAQLSKLDFAGQVRGVFLVLHAWYEQQGLTTRCANLKKVLEFVSEWQDSTTDELILQNYLSHLTEINSQYDIREEEDSVKIMTVHSAKGLEFPVVIMPGAENLTFPFNNKADTVERRQALQEERRLFYVGMSRSMQSLHITYSGKRIVRGRDRDLDPSIFITEAGLAASDMGETESGKGKSEKESDQVQ